MKLQLKGKIVDLLKKDLNFADFALVMLNQEMAPLERKHSMTWRKFLDKFEQGCLGDDKKWFKWYALTQFTLDWHDTKKEIKSALRNS